jgi:hypothetical protein
MARAGPAIEFFCEEKPSMRTIEKPTYLLESVDNTLRRLHAIFLQNRIM